MKRYLVTGLLVALSGCAAGDSMRQVQAGQTRQQVVGNLGHPDGVTRNGSVETLTYANRLMSGWSWDRATYQVQITDGRVSSFGPVDIRSRESPITPVVIIPTGR